METKGVLLAGVGGQGILLASRILAAVLVDNEYDVKVSEVHGMAQRGGDVHCMLRYGDDVASPLIGIGEADILLAFEEVEALRWIGYLRRSGKVFINRQRIMTTSMARGESEYPDALGIIRRSANDLIVIDALDLAKSAGSSKAVNIVLLGAVSRCFEFTDDIWKAKMSEIIPDRFIDMNFAAFDLGREAGTGEL